VVFEYCFSNVRLDDEVLIGVHAHEVDPERRGATDALQRGVLRSIRRQLCEIAQPERHAHPAQRMREPASDRADSGLVRQVAVHVDAVGTASDAVWACE